MSRCERTQARWSADRPREALQALQALQALYIGELRTPSTPMWIITLGTPQDLRDDPLFRGISLLARPPAVTERLAAAAESLVIVHAAGAPETTDWVAVAEKLDETWPSLVTHCEQVTTLRTARCFGGSTIRGTLQCIGRSAASLGIS